MRLSTAKETRRSDVLGVLSRCTASQNSRSNFYEICRQRYLFGATPFAQTKVNKIRPIVDRKSAFLYASDNVKFWVDVTPDERLDTYYHWLDPVADAIGDWWWSTDLDTLFGQAVQWANVYGAMILCVQPEPCPDQSVELVAHLVHPRNFGVWRPEQPDLTRQEAFSLTTYFTLPEVRRRLAFHPRRDTILEEMEQSNPAFGSGDGAIVMGPGATVFQAQYGYGGSYNYTPEIGVEPYYKFHDLYLYDDKANDWRLFTLTGSEIVHDRLIEDVGLPHTPPFIKVCPDELPDYFWGISLVETLTKTQEWFSGRMEELDQLVAKVLNPPKAAIGIGQSYEEKLGALNRPRGRAAFPNAAARIEEFQPQVPAELFNFLEQVDGFFNDLSGMRPSMWGKQESGTRTEGMAASLLRLGGAEIKRQSATVEKQAEDAADLLLKLQKRYLSEPLIDDRGQPFLLAQFPSKFRCRVDGHSASPLFLEEQLDKANMLRKYGDITPERYVRMIHPPMEGAVTHDLRKIQWANMIAERTAQKMQALKRGGAGGK